MNTTGFEKHLRKGYIFVIIAALLWGVSGSSAKFLFNSGITPFQLVQLRLTLSVGILFGVLAALRPSLLRISIKDIGYFIFFGTVGMAGVQFTYLYAISKINVATAVLLQYMAPFFIVIYSALFLKEKPSRATTLALVSAFTGCYFVVGAYNLSILSMNLSGVLSAILSAIAFAWYGIYGEYGMRRYDPWTVLFFAFVFAALVWNIAHPPLEAFFHEYTWIQWGWILYIALFGTLVPFGLYLKGVNLIRAARAGITATLEPIVAGILSAVFLNEILSPLQIFGGVLVIAAVILLQLKQEFDEKAPAVIRAKALEYAARSKENP
ncbi:MAG: EamA family transporter [Desulfobacterales bacterium CG07_land_8_20_14_0_80_52_14]|nr:MAG: EamA family transporter [Desulfobacterales bacterium CG23_combo_of_CG06-09_8_20_14_all_52_9]PIU49093.1 MAG: EamA family transporter [Desulfobacterales bacterium CG07_land_8_20_14_0_80_52_14]